MKNYFIFISCYFYNSKNCYQFASSFCYYFFEVFALLTYDYGLTPRLLKAAFMFIFFVQKLLLHCYFIFVVFINDLFSTAPFIQTTLRQFVFFFLDTETMFIQATFLCYSIIRTFLTRTFLCK